MAGSSFGNIFKITTWGESHGKALGVIVDGVPAGLLLCEEDIQVYLNRRKPGSSEFATQRSEADQVEILSGIFEGKTTGTPISLMIRNTSQRSHDYTQIAEVFRPGHADYGFTSKFGFRDYRGGGRSSGRETAGRVAGGAIAAKILGQLGIEIKTYAIQIGKIKAKSFNYEESKRNPLCMPDAAAAKKAAEYLNECMNSKDSAGGVIECAITGIKPGIGDPVFEKLDANLAKAIMSIGAVKGFEIGEGFAAASLKGSENNDPFTTKDGVISKTANHSGGVLGGMSDGSPIIFRAAVKPTPSIAQMQKTINSNGHNVEVEIKGRHDPIIVPRAVVVVECMAAVTVLDALLMNMGSRMEYLENMYNL